MRLSRPASPPSAEALNSGIAAQRQLPDALRGVVACAGLTLRLSVSCARPDVHDSLNHCCERAALVGPVRVVVAGRHDRADAGQVRRMGDRGEHLRGAHVGATEHADLAIGIRQRRRPLHRVVAVVRTRA